MQYPAEKRLVFSTRVMKFLDGSEQRFREYERVVRRWVISLDLLDGREWFEMESFFLSMQGRAGTFTFTDPWDGVEYANCSLEEDRVRISLLGEERAQLSLVIREDLT
jgi:hypothetical protein